LSPFIVSYQERRKNHQNNPFGHKQSSTILHEGEGVVEFSCLKLSFLHDVYLYFIYPDLIKTLVIHRTF